MTQEREIEIESRLTALETTVADIKRLLESRSGHWIHLITAIASGSLVAIISRHL